MTDEVVRGECRCADCGRRAVEDYEYRVVFEHQGGPPSNVPLSKWYEVHSATQTSLEAAKGYWKPHPDWVRNIRIERRKLSPWEAA